MRLVRLEIIAMTYRSTICKTPIFSLYSPLCIYVSLYVYSYPSTDGISGLAADSASEQFKVHLKMIIEWTEWCTWRWWLNQLGDAWVRWYLSQFGGHEWVSWEKHCKALIKWVWGCTWRPWWCNLGGHDWTSLEMLLEGHNRANLDSVVKQVWRCETQSW